MQAAAAAFLSGEYADSTFVDNFQALIDLYLRQKNFAGADVQLHQLIAFHPALKNLHYQLGEVQRAEHLDKLALASYETELKLNPGYKPAIDGRDAALKALGPSSAATVAGDIPNYASAYLLEVSQDFSFAWPLPDQYSSADPAKLESALTGASVETQLSVGSTALQTGQLDIATRAFNAASANDPKDWRAPYLAGLTARTAGDGAGARAGFDEALKRAARPEPLIQLAVVELDAGDTRAANTSARRALELDRSNAISAFVAGMLAIVASDTETAERDLALSLSLGGSPERTAFFLDAIRSGPK